jgi:hypothetical protein
MLSLSWLGFPAPPLKPSQKRGSDGGRDDVTAGRVVTLAVNQMTGSDTDAPYR